MYAPAIVPRGARVDGAHIAGQTEAGAPQMTLKNGIFSSNVILIPLFKIQQR